MDHPGAGAPDSDRASFHAAAAALNVHCGMRMHSRRWRATMPAMDIILNGEPQALPGPCTVLALLESSGLGGRKVAVEVNGTIVPRSLHAEHALKDGDRIEIVHALGGG